MTEFTIDCPHGHQTKSGLPRKIVAVLDEPLSTGETIIAVGPDAFGDTILCHYFNDGRYYESRDSEAGLDLINAPAPKRKGIAEAWINVYADHSVPYEDRESADTYASIDRIACLYVREEVEEGTGLDEQPESAEPNTVKIDNWANVYENGRLFPYQTKATANAYASDGRLACIHIVRDVTVGEGLHD